MADRPSTLEVATLIVNHAIVNGDTQKSIERVEKVLNTTRELDFVCGKLEAYKNTQ